MNRIKPIYTAVIAVALILAGILLLLSGNDDDLFVENQTGRQFYNDPEQAPEEEGSEFISLYDSEDVQQYFYGNYLLELRKQIAEHVRATVSQDIGIVYVEGDVQYTEERELIFTIKTYEPTESEHTVTARITFDDTVATNIVQL